ncbi:transposase [Bradyrhizobium sp. GM6.1]
MGYTFRFCSAGGVDAVESEFGHGRRLRFVARLLDGEAMTDVCREFGVSRKTGYKIFDRYKEQGLAALSDRSRRPVRYANQLPEQIEGLIVRLKAEKPHWGARKIRELLVRRLDGDVRMSIGVQI